MYALQRAALRDAASICAVARVLVTFSVCQAPLSMENWDLLAKVHCEEMQIKVRAASETWPASWHCTANRTAGLHPVHPLQAQGKGREDACWNSGITILVNSHDLRVDVRGVQHDLQDGVILIQLTESITGKEMTFASEHGSGAGAAYHLSPQTQEEKMENLRRLIGFQRKVGIPTTARPEDIYNGNTSVILNLLWMMVDSYCVSIVKEGEYAVHPCPHVPLMPAPCTTLALADSRVHLKLGTVATRACWFGASARRWATPTRTFTTSTTVGRAAQRSLRCCTATAPT